MADAYWTFGVLLALGIAFPGFLYSYWLLFPARVESTRQRIEKSPKKCVFLGVFLLIVIVFPLLILAQVPLPFAQFMAAALAILTLAYAGIGGAAITAQMARRLMQNSQQTLNPSAAFWRAAVAYELAVAFPIIGWFLALPLSIAAALGGLVLSARWLNRTTPTAMPASTSTTDSAVTVSAQA